VVTNSGDRGGSPANLPLVPDLQQIYHFSESKLQQLCNFTHNVLRKICYFSVTSHIRSVIYSLTCHNSRFFHNTSQQMCHLSVTSLSQYIHFPQHPIATMSFFHNHRKQMYSCPGTYHDKYFTFS
jgi:hypothetical protein